MAAEKKLRETLTETQAQVAQQRQVLAQIRAAVVQQTNILKAIVGILGEDAVKAEVERQAAEEQAATEAQQAEGVKAMVEQGILVKAEVSGPKSFIVGTDTFDVVEGQPTQRPQRVQFEVAQIKADLQTNYLGKKPGDVVAAPGGKFTINEVYDIDVVRAVENAKKAQEAMQAAAQAETAPTPPAPAAETAPTPPAPAAEAAPTPPTEG